MTKTDKIDRKIFLDLVSICYRKYKVNLVKYSRDIIGGKATLIDGKFIITINEFLPMYAKIAALIHEMHHIRFHMNGRFSNLQAEIQANKAVLITCAKRRYLSSLEFYLDWLQRVSKKEEVDFNVEAAKYVLNWYERILIIRKV